MDTPERLLSSPVDSYVEEFLGFDRGIRRLSFLAASDLDLTDSAVVPADTPAAQAAQAARRASEPWLLVTDAGRKPLGWAAVEDLDALPAAPRRPTRD